MKKDQTDAWLSGLRGPTHWRPDDARRVLEEWMRSGVSRSAFGRRHGFNPQRIAWWRKQFAMPTSLTLVPLTVAARSTATPAPTTAGSGALTLVFADHLRIEVGNPTKVAPEWLAAFVDALSPRSA